MHGKFVKQDEIFDLHLCIQTILDSYEHISRKMQIEINLLNNFQEDLCNYVPKMVIADKVRFRQCCSALI